MSQGFIIKIHKEIKQDINLSCTNKSHKRIRTKAWSCPTELAHGTGQLVRVKYKIHEYVILLPFHSQFTEKGSGHGKHTKDKRLVSISHM